MSTPAIHPLSVKTYSITKPRAPARSAPAERHSRLMFATAAPVLFDGLGADVVVDSELLPAPDAVLAVEAVVWLLPPATVVVAAGVVSAFPLDVVAEPVESPGNSVPAHSWGS
jgi:hypothetical protein